MSVIHKLNIDGTIYVIEDATAAEMLNDLSMPYDSSGTYTDGTLGKVVQDMEQGSDIATSAELIAALFS